MWNARASRGCDPAVCEPKPPFLGESASRAAGCRTRSPCAAAAAAPCAADLVHFQRQWLIDDNKDSSDCESMNVCACLCSSLKKPWVLKVLARLNCHAAQFDHILQFEFRFFYF
jgi:hypothetical protein